MSDRQLISEDYLGQQRELHKNPHYGEASLGFAPLVRDLLKQTGFKALSDYGAGKRVLWSALQNLGVNDVEYYPYDPVFPEYGEPKPAPLVCCFDVLEHIEEEYLDRVLLDLKSITQKVGFFSVHTGPAIKFLPDGRNAHIIQQPASWWLPRLCAHFEIAQMQRTANGFWVLAEPIERT